MPLSKTHIKQIILDCSNNPTHALKFSSTDKAFVVSPAGIFDFLFSSSAAAELVSMIRANNLNVTKAFSEAYEEGIDCTVFQNRINEACGVLKCCPSESKINFLEKCTENWMSRLPDELKDKHLNELTLPGTHDSGASIANIDEVPLWAAGKTGESFLKILTLPGIKHLASWIINKWTITQTEDIEGQLKKGVRVFDFRLAKDNKNNLYLSHTFLGEKFELALKKIEGFIDRQPSEVVVINLKPDPFFKAVLNESDIAKAHEKITETLGRFVLPKMVSLEDITVREMITSRRNIVFYSRDFSPPERDTIFRHQGSEEIWPNKPTPEALVFELQKAFKENRRTHEFVYASMSCTVSNPAIIAEGTVCGKSLVSLGKYTQKRIDEILTAQRSAEVSSASRHVAGYIMDSPTPRAVQQIIRENRSSPALSGTYAEREEENTARQPSIVSLVSS